MRETSSHNLIYLKDRGRRRCLACGDVLPPRNRRYCSMDCRQHLLASLNRRSGLLQALNTRYATFYFTEFMIVMDLLPNGTEQIYSYMLPRTAGKKPVADFCELSNILGTLWWRERHRTKKRYLASQRVLAVADTPQVGKDAVVPVALSVPTVRMSSLITLELQVADLTPANMKSRIKQAYRRQAMKHHPDIGGSAQAFHKIQEAYERLLHWAKHPTFTRRSGFPDKWLYEGEARRWIQPIVPTRKSKF